MEASPSSDCSDALPTRTGEQRAINAHVPSYQSLGDDALRERSLAYETEPGPEHPIVLRDLRKVFPKADGNPAKVAVDNMSLVVSAGECFGCATAKAKIA